MSLRGITVLIVEDDVDNRELLCAHVESEGARVVSAGSVDAALRAVDGLDIDVALCDLELSDGDGCELLRHLRTQAGYERVPAVAVTGYSDERWRKRALGCGFARYVVKPYALEHITACIAELATSALR